MRRNSTRDGFTIVELVIVITVIAVLASVLVPSFGSVIQNARDSADKQAAKNAYTQYMVEHAKDAEKPYYFLYEAGENRIIAIRGGQIVGIYADKPEALNVMVPGADPALLAETEEGKLWVYDGEGNSEVSPYAGKVISVLGDSISTFAGYIPTADGHNLEHLARYAPDYEATGLTDVNETYWMQVIHQLGAKLGINDSWRGAMVSGWSDVTTGVKVGDRGERASFADLQRIRNLDSNGTPDVILFYGGTNDLAHGNKLGMFDPVNAPTQPDLTRKTVWDNLADAYCETLLRLKHFYPDTKLVAILPAETVNYYKHDLAAGNALMAEICTHYGVPFVDLRGKGVTVTAPGDTIHPNMAGMDRITELVLELLGAQRDVVPGENRVCSVTHALRYTEASKSYYQGVSFGSAFEEELNGDDLQVTVTMGGKNITEDCYEDGRIQISAVTGDIVITARSSSPWGTHLQERPDGADSSTNLWTAVKRENLYYTANGWGDGGMKNVWSITVPVQPGERIYASSFGSGAVNGSGGTDGIRVVFLLESGEVLQRTHDVIYKEFKAKGYIDVPGGAIAVSIPMWNNTGNWEVYIGYTVGEFDTRLQQLPEDYNDETNLWDYLKDKTIGERYKNGQWESTVGSDLQSVLISVNGGMKLSANSFMAKGENGNSVYDGIRITWFFDEKAPVEMLNDAVYSQYRNNGCVAVPEGAVAVNLVWWNAVDANFLYITK